MTITRFLTALAFLAASVPAARAAEIGEHCLPDMASLAPKVRPAAFTRPVSADKDVKLTFVGHSTFLIQSPGGVKIATDYNDYVKPAEVPDIATMNKAHTTHFSYNPDPRIKHVLKGWRPGGGPAEHSLTHEDVFVRNVPTNIRDFGGNTEEFGNSIFVFETANLCIAHLGHLHHVLTQPHFAKLGRVDVLLVPVDGAYTLDLPGMTEVVTKLSAKVIIPMHYFGPSALRRFTATMEASFPVEYAADKTVVLSRETLPKQTKVLVLPGY